MITETLHLSTRAAAKSLQRCGGQRPQHCTTREGRLLKKRPKSPTRLHEEALFATPTIIRSLT